MEWWHALILGIVEGITEYLPISSTGHLLVTQRLLGISQGEAADAFAICIQAGAILAVLGIFRVRVLQIIQGFFGRSAEGLRLGLLLILAFLPAMALALTLGDWIKEELFGGGRYGMWPIVFAWFVGGVAILMAQRFRDKPGTTRKPLESLTPQAALIIGLLQCIAMWPGMSRSLLTILGGLLVGLSMPAALEFAFLLGVVTLGAATAHDALKHGDQMLSDFGPVSILVGLVAAWVSAVVAVKWMLSYLRTRGLAIFGWYRIAIALVVALAIWLGAM